MLKKVVVLLAALGGAFAIMMLTTRGTSFAVGTSLAVDQAPAAVWTALTAVEQWPRWWPGMEEAKVSPGWQPGAALTVVLKGNAEKSPATVEVVTAGRELAWRRPGVLGSTTRTTVKLDPAADGTLVSLESSIVGPQAFLAKFTGREEFVRYNRMVLEGLKSRLGAPVPAAGGAQ